MIELSKCPNCSEDDRVTIAGKDFCMRCGTPTEDNAMMDVNNSQSNAAEQMQTNSPINAAQEHTPQAAADSVQKFNTQPPVSDELSALNSAEMKFTPPPRMSKPEMQEATALNQTSVDQAPAEAISIPAIITTHQPQAPAAPNEVVAPIPASNTMPAAAAMGTMSLDKKAGVLSDDQFDQLKASVNTAVAQNNPNPNLNADILTHQAPAVNTSQTAAQPNISQPGPQDHQNKIAMATDIYSGPAEQPKLQEEHKSSQPNTEKSKNKAGKVAKPVAIAVSIAALFATGAYIWRINYPSLAFKIASAKAGISATMPGYVPAGYNLGGRIQTNPGTVSYSLLGGSNDNRISVTQSKTDWDSQALAENYVAPKAENYLALQAQGLTIYVLGKNEATWVNKGTWYKLDSKGQDLNQDQIIKIATSL
ncbi:hypothetical protein LBMAG34_1610 [Candidatus Saccharibacteria bacterium]|nr:hypothetical protein LBMAG34_1610 [Candidatus Saccharibacteria bacterium]